MKTDSQPAAPAAERIPCAIHPDQQLLPDEECPRCLEAFRAPATATAQPSNVPYPIRVPVERDLGQLNASLAALPEPERLDVPALHADYQETTARDTANQFLRALRSIEAEMAAAQAELDFGIERLKARHAARELALSERAGWLLQALEHLFAFLPLRGGKKSVKLLEGRLGMREKQREGVELDELAGSEAAVLAWAQRELPEAVETKPQLRRAELKKGILARIAARALKVTASGRLEQITSDGEVIEIPALRYRAAKDAFYADPGAEA